jgi:hypothetical protein
VGTRSSTLIIILVLGILSSMFYASGATYSAKSVEIFTKPTISDTDAINIAKQNLELETSPNHVDKFVTFSQYYGHHEALVFIHNNGTQFYIDSANHTIYDKCVGCNFSNIISTLKGHLFYVIDGSWQDSFIRNCSPYMYTIDANSGEILWSYVGGINDKACNVRPADW